MSDSMDEILLVFFQECDEQLQELERGLSALEGGETDHDTINAIFRAVHSIKGGAASFGLENLVRFAHIFETSLDALRSGRVQPTHDVIKILLKAMDVLSDLVTEAKGGADVDAARVAESQTSLETLHAKEDTPDSADSLIPADFEPVAFDFTPVPIDFEPVPVSFDFGDEPTTEGGDGADTALPIQVTFCPHKALYERGDDARNLLIGLRDLAADAQGEAEIRCDVSHLPALTEIDASEPCLSWCVVLPATVSEDSIHAVFDWVSDVCDITISRGTGSGPDDGGGTGKPQPEHSPPEDAAEPETDLNGVVATEVEPVAAVGSPASYSAPLAVTEVQPPKIAPAGVKVNLAASPAISGQKGERGAVKKRVEQASIRVDLQRVDELMDLVGELVIAQATLETVGLQHDANSEQEMARRINSMRTLTRDIQNAVMAVRAQPVGSVFQRMQRVVREACSLAHKDVALVVEGEDTEVDRTLVEKLSDPLTHMLRNAVDHGVEAPEARLAAGKPEQGRILLSASHRSGRILITIQDDGAGINQARVLEIAVKRGIVAPDATLSEDEINNLIFAPGFSTASSVSDLSGRGVGMDVVKQAILGLGGRISITSVPGKGTTFCLSLPLTLAVLDGMLVMVAGTTMVVPVSSVVETLMVHKRDMYTMPDGRVVISIRGVCMPLLVLATELGLQEAKGYSIPEKAVILVVESETGARVALVVEDIKDQAQVVIKSMEKNYRQIPGVSAATILGDGSVSLILDVPALVASTTERADGRLAEPASGIAA
ncbi:MAG: chemotaxis protein CheA [Acetobacter orientalis]|uniref:chemotaxis protein CheA n=1 Tax=Acetobacter orientalis TaxID=146474 RepID=UPI0039E9B944